MRWAEYIDETSVRRAISLLQEPGAVFEVRVIGTAKKDIMSGYFRDAETLLKDLDNIDLRQKNVYITLGKVKDECFARAQSEHFLKSPQTTSDTEIERYRWLFVDLDPVRAAGISSSDEELATAKKLSEAVQEYMLGLGFSEPVRAMSGNGYHLLYRIDVKNDVTGHALIEKCLKVLSTLFNTEKVKIDTTNANPSRICKLHGTMAQKGRNTKARPHRMSNILSYPEKVKINGTDVLRKLAAELPDEPQKEYRRGSSTAAQEFDIRDFLTRHGMSYEEDSNDRAKIFRLDECPFDPSHKDGDAKVFLYQNGAVAFKCHHNSCKQYKWQDVRRKFEPEAYERDASQEDEARIDNGYWKHREQKEIELASEPKPAKPATKTARKIRKLKAATELMKKDLPDPKVFVGVGDELPLLVEGTCILSAKPKLGKSWFVLCMCLAICEGRDFLGYKTAQCSTLYLDLETSEFLQQKRLRKALAGDPTPKNFYIEEETDRIGDGFVEQIEGYLKEDPKIGIVVIDVFQIIRTTAKNIKETEYEHAYRDITPLNELAQKHHIAIILVCHDRKAVDPDDPFANILGSTGLQGAATQMIVMYRPNKKEPIHISVRGKTIDGLPELNVKLENAQWSVVEGGTDDEREQAELMEQYMDSRIRTAVIRILEEDGAWKGRCGELVNEATSIGIALVETPKQIGGFLHQHQGRFLMADGIQINIIQNGSGGKIYEIRKFTVDTVDEKGGLPLMGFVNADKYSVPGNPFL